jgi:hypothetical protein
MLSVFLGIQGDCKENGLEQRLLQNEGKDAKFLLFLVNSWAQEEVSAFQQKQFEYLLQFPLMFKHSSVLRELGFLGQ